MKKLSFGVAAVLAIAFLLFQVAGAGAAATKTIRVGDTNNNSLNDVQQGCVSTGGVILQWHFVINGLANGGKPASITVTWSDGTTQVVPLDSVASAAKVGHYTVQTPMPGLTVTNATAIVAGTWKGQFVLSDATCGTAPPVLLANVTLTKLVNNPFGGTNEVCFTLSPAAGSSSATQCHTFAAPEEQHTFVWNDLPVGTYTVAETTVPPGYQAIPDVSFTVAASCGGAPHCFTGQNPPATYDLGLYENHPLD